MGARQTIPPSSGRVLDTFDRRAAETLLQLHTIGEVAEYYEISVLDFAHQMGLSRTSPVPNPGRARR